jgi:hypothetical protein
MSKMDHIQGTKKELRWQTAIGGHRYLRYFILTLKISSDQIWVDGYFGQRLTYPCFTIFSSDFLCNSLKS